jgi:peptide/nickel transport system ATP-binding protein
MSALLDISKLSLSFRTEKGPARVLDMIDLAVKPGEIVGLVGESGCGKTTLARSILGTLPQGLTEIGSGHIRLDGVDMLRGGKAAENMRGRVVTFVPAGPLRQLQPAVPDRHPDRRPDALEGATPRRHRACGWTSRAPDEEACDRHARCGAIAAAARASWRNILMNFPADSASAS